MSRSDDGAGEDSISVFINGHLTKVVPLPAAMGGKVSEHIHIHLGKQSLGKKVKVTGADSKSKSPGQGHEAEQEEDEEDGGTRFVSLYLLKSEFKHVLKHVF